MFRINVIAALDTAVKVTTDDVMPCMLWWCNHGSPVTGGLRKKYINQQHFEIRKQVKIKENTHIVHTQEILRTWKYKNGAGLGNAEMQLLHWSALWPGLKLYSEQPAL